MRKMLLMSAIIGLFYVGAAFAYTPSLMEISASSQKVPKFRNQVEIAFHVQSLADTLDNISITIIGNGVNVIEFFPSGPVAIDQTGIDGFAIVELPVEDIYYKVFIQASDPGGILNVSTHLFFRNNHGNALELSEDQYGTLIRQDKLMWQHSQAAQKATADLESLRANGLHIAVEKWPKDEEFIPLQNNIGEAIQIHQNSLYEVLFTDRAISDPAFKGFVTTQLRPPDGGVDPCYFATFSVDETSQRGVFEPMCFNILASVKIMAILHRPDWDQDIPWIDSPIQAQISYPGVTEDFCTQSCKTKMFAKNVTLQKQGNYGVAVTAVNVPPSGYYALEAIRFSTMNSNVATGDCHRASGGGIFDTDCWESHPEWTGGTENVYYWENGLYNSDAMIRTVRCDANSMGIPECDGFREGSGDLIQRKYVAIVTVTDYPAEDPDIQVGLIPMFDKLNKIHDYWATHGAMENGYIDYRACPGDFGPASAFYHECSANPIITVREDQLFSDVLYHETGHWLMYRMQGNESSGGGDYSECGVTWPGTAFSEGFAIWHSFYLRYNHDGEQHGDSYCGHQYDIWTYPPAHSRLPANNFNLLWDVFDSWDDPVKDRYCEEAAYGCNDLVVVGPTAIKKWIGHQYWSIWDFLGSWKQVGMPLYGDHTNTCKLQNAHGLLTPDCY